ncbi:hypothetical protein LEMLEM_LOCUS4098 [Lemmus lemmus]
MNTFFPPCLRGKWEYIYMRSLVRARVKSTL